MQLWEQLIIGAFGVLFVVWFLPGVKAKLKESKQAEHDWPAVILPLALVVGLIVFVMMLLKS